MYEVMGQVFLSLLIFAVVWITTVMLSKKSDWADGMLAVFFTGPAFGLIVAVLCWFFIL
jgi:hypothetical protein